MEIDADLGPEIPTVDLAPIPDANPLPAILERDTPLITRLAGAWEQFDSGEHNEPDFAPGGYSRSVVVIDDRSGEFFVYRGFGPPGRPAQMFVSGQFHIDLNKEGFGTIGPSKIKPTTFFSSQRSITVESGTVITILPPRPQSGTVNWSTDPALGVLVLGGKSYRRASNEVRDAVVHGDHTLVDRALDAQISAAMAAAGAAVGVPGTAVSRDAGNVDFFGTRIKGRYVSFVIDCSGSMSTGGKMQSALGELRRVIQALPRDTNVYVVFFSGGAAEVSGYSGWTKAHSPEASRLIAGLVGIGAGGGTNPAPALERAFGQVPRPDEIFFMTDGVMPGDVRDYIIGLNGQSRARTRVHTIAFGADADQATLSAIAADNAGQFRAVR